MPIKGAGLSMAQYQSVVFFDLDGTLMVNPFEAAVWPVIMQEIAETSGASSETIFNLIVEENEARQNDPSGSAVLSMDWDDIAQVVAAKLGGRVSSSCETLVRDHAASHSSVLENALDILHELNAPHRALVVATKGLAKYQQPVLDALGLTPLFAGILTPDSYQALKKNRAYFGAWPAETRLQIMVGDRYDDDVEGPGKHGFKTIWKPAKGVLNPMLEKKDPFARSLMFDYAPDQTTPADAIITSLNELPAIIRRMEQAVLGYSD
jgi:putative hydrolase of the HAD superfamily